MSNAGTLPKPGSAPSPVAAASSRVALLSDGHEAFAARAAAARAARRSLDLQYYMWESDLTGQLLAREVLHAADRGVRVRLLLDDMYALGRESDLTALGAHPRMQLRRFNAARWRRWGRLGLLVEMLFGNWHLNRRMHNKAWIADGQLVICGGRNIGDRYFDASGDFNFRDLDLIVEGRSAAEATGVFDSYWRSRLALSIKRLRIRSNARALERLRAALDAVAASPEAQPFLDRLRDVQAEDRHGLAVEDEAIRILSDAPEKARGRAGSAVMSELTDLLANARREALLISPYFVPGEAGTVRLIDMARAGVRIAVITNSLAATDVVAVHGGYARYRERLIAAGIEIFELKRSEEKTAGVFGSRGASLHTKAIVVDDGPVFVGSFNLDPRSANLNTEMGVLVRHPALARLIRWHHRRLTGGARSWRVRLTPAGRLAWDDGVTVRYGPTEPDASVKRQALARVLRWLPIESQL
ncbi:phospholipase D family protein [Plastoroseomonas hellenica]|uniref:phospholipase D family protein n=1 Tax=Plastoroseomonas hellenica TaxID=2687306 RepID=UPI001BA67885|nr:phospholipase D family protein [Plastoroseomonas hellenica]MBR0642298.1 phospholipase D family protein [Plastoroseomonas hellenica]